MKEIKTISIKCETKDVLNIAEMTELQGKLKARSDIDYDKIKLSIIKYGFSFPFYIWKSGKTNYLKNKTRKIEKNSVMMYNRVVNRFSGRKVEP